MATVYPLPSPPPPPRPSDPAVSGSAQSRPTTATTAAAEDHNDPSSSRAEPVSSSSQIAHTLTACTRCRQRKTRCDPGLPRCGPCERANSVCEYFDGNKGHNVRRSYVVYLQHRVRDLELELERVENEDTADDPEAMMRAATVRMHEAKESKFLGPSSGIAITRLVMQLAKQFNDAKSIKDIVSDQNARCIRDLYTQEQAKPTSKVYPLISDVAADGVPPLQVRQLLIHLYKVKVQPMYPALHEPTLDRDIDAVVTRGPAATPYQQFVTRMVIAISLQKMATMYAGLADSYYLAALRYLEQVVRPMDLKTLQCFALMAEYSTLTPTRTAIYYVVGIAVRLAQALGLHDEKTLIRHVRVRDRDRAAAADDDDDDDATAIADPLEIDMRRRLFWCIVVMDFGLAHSLGRPSILATNHEHINVEWFDLADDDHITSAGLDPNAPRPSVKKWIAMHFFKMRLLQLEIRRKLYRRKRPEPRSDTHPWFIEMDAKLVSWRDAAPEADAAFGLTKDWFVGRYNTMVVLLYRPSPQVPRPSVDAALKCFRACTESIESQSDLLKEQKVDLTWIFAQAIFMAINTTLWALSYEEVRVQHSREEVGRFLDIAMKSIRTASERWPGVASAIQLYGSLIEAILKIYDRPGDVPISAATPSDAGASPGSFPDSQNRPSSSSAATSPATAPSSSIATPPDGRSVPSGYPGNQQLSFTNGEQAGAHPLPQAESDPSMSTPPAYHASPNPLGSIYSPPRQGNVQGVQNYQPTQMGYQQYQQQQQLLLQQQQQYQPNYAPHLQQQQHHHQNANYAPLQQPQQQPQQSHQLQHPQYQPLHPQNIQQFELPEFTRNLTIPGWTAPPAQPLSFATAGTSDAPPFFDPAAFPSHHPVFNPNSASYPFPANHDPNNSLTGMNHMQQSAFGGASWDMDAGHFGAGLNRQEHGELMHSLETHGMEDIQNMISSTLEGIGGKNGPQGTQHQPNLY